MRSGIAVVGAGLIGRRHVELVLASGRCALTAIVDPAPGALDLARQHGVPWHASLDDLLDRDRPDGVILASPSSVHRDQALACIEADIPVLVEKPIATTADDGDQVARAAARRRTPILVGHHRRHSAILRAARRVLDDGVLGRVVTIAGSATFRKPDDYFDEAPWRREAGGGPLLINMVHEVDALRFLAGEVAFVRAFASSSTRGFEVEDSVAIAFAFVSGALGTFLLSDTAASPVSWELTSGENPAYPRHADVDCYVIAGDRGSLGIPTMRLATYADTPSWWEPMVRRTVAVEPVDPLAAQLDHFCDVVDGRATPLVSAADGARNVRLVEAIRSAAATGETIALPGLPADAE